MVMRIETNKRKNILIFMLLFLASMNFYAKFFYFAFAAFFALCLTREKITVNLAALLYLALAALMAAYNFDEGIKSMIRCLAPACLYIVGSNIALGTSQSQNGSICYDAEYAKKTGFAALVIMATGSFTHYILNFILNAGQDLSHRNTIDIWSRDIMAATGQATLACLMLGLSVTMVFLPKKKSFRYIGIVCVAGVLAYDLVLAGRTLLAILGILFALAIIYVLKTSDSTSERVRTFMVITLTVLVLVVIYNANVGGIRDAVLGSNLFKRFDGGKDLVSDNSSRTEAKLNYLRNMLKYPMGGLHMRNQYGYAHDLLLDGYDEYGIFGLLMLLVVLASGVRSLYRLMIHTDYAKETKLAFLCVNCAVWLVFYVEPILPGMQWLFACYALINGIMDAMNVTDFRAMRNNGVTNESTSD